MALTDTIIFVSRKETNGRQLSLFLETPEDKERLEDLEDSLNGELCHLEYATLQQRSRT